MRIYENGIYRDMTQEELDEMNKQEQVQPTQEPNIEERIKSIEEVILNLL